MQYCKDVQGVGFDAEIFFHQASMTSFVKPENALKRAEELLEAASSEVQSGADSCKSSCKKVCRQLRVSAV